MIIDLSVVWHHFKRHIVAASVGGCCVLIGSVVASHGPVVSLQSEQEATPISVRPGYVGVLIDRTRNKVCSVRSTRVLIRNAEVNGETIPEILPLEETGLVLPNKGRAKILLLVPLPNNLPAGPWFTQSISTDYCHWWDFLTGGSVRVSPLVPISSAAVDAARAAP